jgi:hypothetical protein
LVSDAFISVYFQRRIQDEGEIDRTLRAVGAHQLQQCDHLGPGPFGLGLLPAQQKVEEVVVRQVHQCLHRSRLTHGHAGFVPLEEAGDEQVVFEQAAPAAPFQLAQRTFAERLVEFVGGLHGASS